MKTSSWICWLLALYICLSEAKNKIRRPLPPPYAPTLILKMPRPTNHRISMGNTIRIGGNLSHQRIPYKHINYRIRRPTMYNALPTNWKNQIPIRMPLNNHAILPQHASAKEFYSINKVPEYSPEYKPEFVVLPPTHRGGIDDDKGPIHTIPAPNLSPAAKHYNSAANSEENVDRRPYSSDLNYHNNMQNPVTTAFGLATISNSLPPSQRTVTSSIPPQHQYEVTESNDVALKKYQTVQPATLQSQDLDMTKLYSIIINNPPEQSNELFANQPVNSNTGVIGPNIQFGKSSMPMQTNLHSSLHVGFPPTAIQTPYAITQQIPADLHVGYPAPAESPLSATQLYDLLNNFPHKLIEQYTPDQQRILQQQFGQILQPDAATTFSQPQMHSFNYEEQANQLQQQKQQISFNQDYVSESVTEDYNLNLESPIEIRKQKDDVHANEEFTYRTDGVERSENNIEYEEVNHQKNPTTYFDKVADSSIISTKFYTTLPNRETAEKLAALAAAGNVNSHLINQLQKQGKDTQKDEPMPSNHKSDDDGLNQQRINNGQRQKYDQQKSYKSQQHHHKQSYKTQKNDKLPLQITIPDEDDYVMGENDQQSDIRRDNIDIEYEYENENEEIENPQFVELFDEGTLSQNNDSHIEFGSRLRSKSRK